MFCVVWLPFDEEEAHSFLRISYYLILNSLHDVLLIINLKYFMQLQMNLRQQCRWLGFMADLLLHFVIQLIQLTGNDDPHYFICTLHAPEHWSS